LPPAVRPDTKANQSLLKLLESDEEFSWCMTQFLIWPGEHNPALRRQADMGIAIRTTEDDLEELRTSPQEQKLHRPILTAKTF
jgi:hypothetical protein